MSVHQYNVEFTGDAAKEFRKLDGTTQRRIASAIQGLRTNPRPSGVKKLVGYDTAYRIRVGDYRVIYEVLDDTLLVEIFRIRNRRDAYKGM